MLRNYLKVAFRNLLKERLYAGINLFGLSIGIGVAVLLLLYVQDEWSYDRFHTKADRIHRAWVKEQVENEEYFSTVVPFILGDKLSEDFPEIEAIARYVTLSDLVKYGAFSDNETIHVMSPNFFEVFDFKWLQGNPDAFGEDLREILLTPASAQKYYGTAEVVGQELSVRVGGTWQEFQVKGIVEAAPGTSSIQYDMIIPFENTKLLNSERSRQSWTSVNPETYVLFREDVDPQAFEQKLTPYIDQQVAKIYEAGDYQVGFQPLTDIHLNNDYPTGLVSVSDGRYPYILSGIALLILVLAGINFVTLALGRSVNRAREVGVRKVSGAHRWQLMLQFWSEALLISFISTVAGFILAQLFLPLFNGLADKNLDIVYSPLLLAGALGLAILIGILAGVYPALVISSYRPLRAIRGVVSKLGQDKHLVLRGLVSFQFVLSVVLIICTFVMQNQMRFIQNKNLGFDQDQTLVLPYNEAPSNDRGLIAVYEDGQRAGELLRQELADNALIQGVSVSSHAFGTPGWVQIGYQEESSREIRFFRLLNVDDQFLGLSEVDLVSGRTFDRDITTDMERTVIVNRAMAENLGMTDPIGQAMPKPFEQFQIIGLTEDFNYGTLHSPVEPLVITMNQIGILRAANDVSWNDTPTAKMNVKISGTEVNAAIQAVQDAWQKVAPDQPFEFYFVDAAVGQQYSSERRLSRIISSGSILAILIACLGLFGITTLTVGQRRKEISIRKVLGASMLSIFVMLNKRLTIMVGIATVIASPVAYWLMTQWLNDFEFRVGLSPLWFLLAAIISIAIAWLAVSFQSVRAARVNPAESLKAD